MTKRREGWQQLVGRVGTASAELLAAEARSLRGELAASGRRLGWLAAIAGLAFGVLFWGLGVVLVAAIAGVALVLPLWASALLVAAVLFLVAVTLGLWVRSRLRAFESPTVTVRRHIDEHVEWWQNEVMAQAAAGRGDDAGDSGRSLVTDRDALEQSRARLASALADVREGSGGRVGPSWLVPVVAGALGLTLAFAVRRRWAGAEGRARLEDRTPIDGRAPREGKRRHLAKTGSRSDRRKAPRLGRR